MSSKDTLTLYHYWRSSSSWRVRWALELKKAKVNYVAIDLLKSESESPEHLKRHPLGFVPVLEVAGKCLIESVAIVEFLEEYIPAPALYPGNSYNRAQVRALVEIINSDTQPLQNLGVSEMAAHDDKGKKEWNQYFIRRGLTGYEKLCEASYGEFSVGNQITAADLWLIPQCYNARRNDVDLAEFPIIEKIFNAAMATPEAKSSCPESFQP